MQEPIKELLKEVSIFSVGSLVVLGLNYYGIIKLSQDLSIGTGYYIIMAATLWILLGFYMMIAA